MPTFEEAIAARNTADKLKAQKAPLSPDQQQTLDAAEKTFARRIEQNILNQQAGIEKRGGKLHPTTAKALADAQVILARPGPGGNQGNSSPADNTTSHQHQASPGNFSGAATGTTFKTAEGRLPGQAPETQLEVSPNQSPQFKDSPSSPPPNSGSSSPGPGLSQMSSSGAALPSPQLQNHVRAAISGHNGNFPGLNAPIAESAAPNGYNSGMWLNEDGSIGYHVPTLAKQFAGMDAQTINNHVSTQLHAHVQASPENTAPAAVSPITRSPLQPDAKSRSEHLNGIKNKLEAHVEKWRKTEGQIFVLQDDLNRAVMMGDHSMTDRIETRLAALEVEMQSLIDESRLYVMLPKGSSGKVRFTSLTPTTKSAAEAGAKLAETYIHASLLPTLGVIDYNRRRAGYLNGMLLLNNMTNPSTAMHEITHGIEEQNPHVLAASLSFLEKRAGNESPQLLRELTGNSAYTTEIAYEDEFASRGGDHYMGRRYLGDDGTEILTMGIERLHKNPVEFYVNDPEYFEFVINTLQNP